jgi:uncharacterized OB-fold protein
MTSELTSNRGVAAGTEIGLEEYRSGIESNRLMVRQCRQCHRYFHPRQMQCVSCGTPSLEWTQASGRGTVYSFSVLDHYAPGAVFKAALPYCVGIVHLQEDIYLFTRFICSDFSRVKIGAPVAVRFDQLEGGQTMPTFALLDEDQRNDKSAKVG